MNSEHTRTHLKLGRDPRLTAGVIGAVEHVARRAGLNGEQQARLVAAAEQTCRKVISQLDVRDPFCSVTVECFDDRIEIRFEHAGEALPAFGLDSFAADAPVADEGPRGMELMKDVDRVLYEARGGRSSVTLIKSLNEHRPKA